MAFSWRKKMLEKPEVEEEMSMEEILTSIRKYVIDEKGSTLVASTIPQDSSSHSNGEDDEDIIELKQPLDEPETSFKKEQQPVPITPAVVTSLPSAATAKQNSSFFKEDTMDPSKPSHKTNPPPSQSTARTANIPPAATSQSPAPLQEKRQHHTPFRSAQYPFQPLPSLSAQPPEPVKINEETATTDEPLVSPQIAFDTAQAFARLAEVAHPPEHKAVLTGDTTIEQLITEVTKPIIKTWLDQNLPSIVETMVAKEIERITRR